jgi:hypothetical protein
MRYTLEQADEKSLTVRTGSNKLPVPWRLLSARDRASVTSGIARDEDAETLLIAAVMHCAAGQVTKGKTFLARAALADAEAAKALEKQLYGPQESKEPK